MAAKKTSSLQNSTFITTLGEEGILHVKVKKGAEITIKEAEENTAFVVELSEGEILPMLVDTRDIKSISKEARDHFAMKNRKGKVNSIAILIDNPLSRIVGNFFMGLNKPSVPTRLFTDEKKAKKWLQEYL